MDQPINQPTGQEPQPSGPESQPEPSLPPMGDEKDIQENKLITVLSYIGILCLIPLLAKRESKFAQFHARQGLILVIAEFVSIPLMAVVGLGALLQLAAFVLSIIGIINVAGGKAAKLPVVGNLAEKIHI